MKKKLQKKDFTGKTIFVGMDVHKKTWHAAIIFGEVMTKKSFPSDPKQVYTYLSRAYPGAEFHIAYEAGFSGFWTCEILNRLGAKTIVANPADIPTTDKEEKFKTDRNDSKKIAKCLKAGLLNGIYLPSIKAQEDRSLLRHRDTLVKDQTRIKNRIKSELMFYGIEIPDTFANPGSHWSKKFILWLETIKFRTNSGGISFQSKINQLKFIRQELLDITIEIRKLSRTKTYKKQYDILTSAPGIGLITAMGLLTEVIDIKRFPHLDKLLSFIGLVPTERSSGEKQKKGNMTKRRNAKLRKLIIEASWIAIRNDPVLGLYYSKNKIRIGAQKAIVKVARKLVSKLYYLWNNEEMYVKGVV